MGMGGMGMYPGMGMGGMGMGGMGGMYPGMMGGMGGMGMGMGMGGMGGYGVSGNSHERSGHANIQADGLWPRVRALRSGIPLDN